MSFGGENDLIKQELIFIQANPLTNCHLISISQEVKKNI
jgi:hypothetical protein